MSTPAQQAAEKIWEMLWGKPMNVKALNRDKIPSMTEIIASCYSEKPSADLEQIAKQAAIDLYNGDAIRYSEQLDCVTERILRACQEAAASAGRP